MVPVGSSPAPPPRPVEAAALPRDILLAAAGTLGIVLVVVLAVVIRPVPFAELDEGSPEVRSGARALAAAEEGESKNAPVGQERAPVAAGASRELRAKLAKEVRGNKNKEAVDTLEALVAADPRAAEDVDVRADVLELASDTEYQGGKDADRVFDAISFKMGTTGPDVLYALATTKGGSKAGNRAVTALKQESVRARATPALRIAFDLWSAKSCPDKAALLDRARDEGDGRALGWVQVLARNCQLSKDPKVEAAMTAIKSRMR